MENLNNIDWNTREKELQDFFLDKFRRVWLQYSRLGSICITAFPYGVASQYKMFFAYKVQDFSIENLKNIVLSQI